MKTYPYPTPDGITQLVEEAEYNRLKWELEESKAKHGADVAELNERLTQQQADMLDTIVKLRAELTSWQAMAERLATTLKDCKNRAMDKSIETHADDHAKGCIDDIWEWAEQALAAYESARKGELPEVKLWCSYCGAHGYHTSGSCPQIALAEAVKRMEAVPYADLSDELVTVEVAQHLDRVRARLIAAAKGEQP